MTAVTRCHGAKAEMPARGVPASVVGRISFRGDPGARASDRGRSGRTRPSPHLRENPVGSPPRAQFKARWLLGHRESVRKLLPRHRRGRPGNPRVPGDRGGPGQVCGRPARPNHGRRSGSAARRERHTTDAADQDQDTSLVCRYPPCRRVHPVVGKRGRPSPLQEGGQCTHCPGAFPKAQADHGTRGLPPVPPLH